MAEVIIGGGGPTGMMLESERRVSNARLGVATGVTVRRAPAGR